MGFTKSIASRLVLFVAALSAVVDATALTTTQQHCYTRYGSTKPAKCSTTTVAKTLTSTATLKVTSTQTSTITPAPVTATSTVFSTSTSTSTLSQTTDTFSSTTTFFDTATQTFTATSLSTTTSSVTTTSTGTSTIPTSSGFTPVASLVAANGFTPSKRKRDLAGKPLKARGEDLEERRASQPSTGCTLRPNGMTPTQYPQAVSCKKAVQIVSTTTKTYTATSTTTITLAPSTVTTTSTSTLTEVDTATVADASTTLSFSTTSTLSQSTTTTLTSTLTTTVTNTVLGPTATVYAACATNNIVTFVSGYGIGVIDATGTGSSLQDGSASSALDCCNQCQAAGSACAGSAFIDGDCFFLTPPSSQTCSATFVAGTFDYDNTASGDAEFVVSNGGCGQYAFGGAA